MKLLPCKSCQDVFKLDFVLRTCKCGLVGGKYLDAINAEYFGTGAVPLRFVNSSLVDAIDN